jgi:hypothetical protein
MKSVLRFSVFLSIALLLSVQSTPAATDSANIVQIAIVLDASNSMDGLISQAKSQLWKIVNEFALAKKDGSAPLLQVALYEYGKDNLSSSEGHIRRIVGLTTDLDKISEELFALTTNGGQEYCGQVIQKATQQLAWIPGSKNFKAIFIAGNEPFTQGSISYKEACKAAITSGIIVNTIFCGSQQEGISTGWKDGADLADGRFFNIDQNKTIAYVQAPQDSAITALGRELNATYIAYGSSGALAQSRQASQDMAAASVAGEVAVQRAMAKSSKQYRSDSWDLVDAKKSGNLKLSQIKKEDLPAEMQAMDEKEREVYVDTKAQERAVIQERITALQAERRTFVENKEKKQSGGQSLDAAIIKAIRTQATQKKYTFE